MSRHVFASWQRRFQWALGPIVISDALRGYPEAAEAARTEAT